MDYEERRPSTIITVLITAVITLSLAIFGANYYYTSDKWIIENFDRYIQISDASKEIDARIELVKTYIDKYYFGEIDEEKLIESAVKGYVRGLGDVYTAYLTEDEYNDLMIDVHGNYVGIGIYMSQDKDGNVVVVTPMEGSAAEESGLQPGDIILKVDGEECSGKDLTLISNKIKGEEGTKVELELWRDGELLTKTIERRTVVINYIKSEILENNIGYIQIISFDGKSANDFQEHFEALKSKNIKSLIIDIRDNGGGVVTQVIEIAEMMVPKGEIIMRLADKEGNEDETRSRRDPMIDMEIVVLINDQSASASEILAGALKDNGIATIVGTTSFGKGVMQEIFKLKSGGAMKVTIQEFKTPNGDKIHKNGVEPDHIIEQSKEAEEDEQLQKAIELLQR